MAQDCATFTYNSDDGLTNLTLGNSAKTDYTYDSYGRLTAFDRGLEAAQEDGRSLRTLTVGC